MIGCKCAIYQRGRFCLEPLVIQMSQSDKWDWLTITRKSSEGPICGATADALVRSDTSFPIESLPQWLYLWRPYLRWRYLWGSGQMFQPTEPIKPTKAIKQLRDQLIYIDASKKWAYLHWLPTWQTKMAIVLTFSSVHKTSLLAVHIEPTKAITSLRVNIKPTRPTTSRAHLEVYGVFQDHQEAAAHLSAR